MPTVVHFGMNRVDLEVEYSTGYYLVCVYYFLYHSGILFCFVKDMIKKNGISICWKLILGDLDDFYLKKPADCFFFFFFPHAVLVYHHSHAVFKKLVILNWLLINY